MDIKLKARLSAYSRFPQKSNECDADVVTKEEIDSLFSENNVDTATVFKNNKNTVSFTEIDSLFN